MLTGSRQVNRWAKGRHIHFAMRMSRKPDRVQFFGDDGKPAPDGATSIKGNKLKVAFFFDDAGGPPILIKTGLSAVDVPGARDALAQEVPAWDFRSEEHTSELQSLMRISYAVFCLQQKNHTHQTRTSAHSH